MINFQQVEFVLSAFAIRQLPPPDYPEVAFAGRSNVGKSSLINRVLGRKNLVKTSSRPGKTQSLNYFLVDNQLYLVDLPGYGYAKVSRDMQAKWQQVITSYLAGRERLACVVVIIDIRHALKQGDRELIDWLRHHDRPFLPVYTKADKLSRNRQHQHAAALDAALNINASDRLIFSSLSGEGTEELKSRLALLVETW